MDKFKIEYGSFIRKLIDNAKNHQVSLLQKFYKAFGHDAYDLSILSFLQHYGAPTPLMDFTYRFAFAAFFATDDLKHNPSNGIDNFFSIYSIDTNPEGSSKVKSIIEIIQSYLSEDADNIDEINKIEELKYEKFSNHKLFYIPGYDPEGYKFTLKDTSWFQLVFNQHNLNIINQEGLFVFNSSPSEPLEYCSNGGESAPNETKFPEVKCWNIHKGLKFYIIDYLNNNFNCPINKSFMYPKEEDIAKNAINDFLKTF